MITWQNGTVKNQNAVESKKFQINLKMKAIITTQRIQIVVPSTFDLLELEL